MFIATLMIAALGAHQPAESTAVVEPAPAVRAASPTAQARNTYRRRDRADLICTTQPPLGSRVARQENCTPRAVAERQGDLYRRSTDEFQALAVVPDFSLERVHLPASPL